MTPQGAFAGSCGAPPHASPYGKGRWCEAPEGIRKSAFDKVNRNADINPQKGRHLLCSFCPYSARSAEQERKGTLSHGDKEGGAI